MFDYMHVFDLGKIMSWMINAEPKYNIYNACSGQRVSLLEIAQIIKTRMNSNSDIIVLKDGWNNEYTASNDRLKQEYTENFISLQDGIDIQIAWEKENYKF